MCHAPPPMFDELREVIDEYIDIYDYSNTPYNRMLILEWIIKRLEQDKTESGASWLTICHAEMSILFKQYTLMN